MSQSHPVRIAEISDPIGGLPALAIGHIGVPWIVGDWRHFARNRSEFAHPDPSDSEVPGEQGRRPLTERERQVLAATDRGADLDEIAKTLFLSHGTVRNHLSNAIQKLGARNRSEAARVAEAKGWL